MEICFATNNDHKLVEVKSLLPGVIKLLSLDDIGCKEELPETGETLEDNSLQKAEYIQSRFTIDCFADDTGLEVDALDGRPGVYSARYAGEPPDSTKNIQKLLSEMKEQPNRKARFRTVVTLLIEGQTHLFEGVVDGTIANEPKGNNGFGYDPIFIPNGYNTTFAQMESEEKNYISHRGKAIRKLTVFLSQKINSK